MRPFRLLATVVAGLALSACGDTLGPMEELPRELSVAEVKLIEADNRFAFKLFKEINDQADPDQNIFISPLSAAMALGMTYNGAAGTTRDAMQQTLELEGMTIEEVNESYRSLIDLLQGLDPRVEWILANSIWYRNDRVPLQTFVDVNRTFFDAEVMGLDFSDLAASQTINSWVSDKTRGRIEEIVAARIPAGVIMYLLNAVYFKGSWKTTFDEDLTWDGPFTLIDGSHVATPMMRNLSTLQWRYHRGDDAEILDLPYGSDAYTMTVILPAEPDGVLQLVRELTEARWEEWMSAFDSTKLDVYLPKWELEYELTMNSVLVALGMGQAFTPEADFGNMYPAGGVWIDEVLHKTFIKVDEEGTEAAAATSVGGATSVRPKPTFSVDHPFLFFIRERHSGAILFMGKMMNPAAD